MHVVRNVWVYDMCTCTIIAADLEPIHPANQMAPWARGERKNRFVPDFGHNSTPVWLSLIRSYISLNPTHGSTLPKKKHLSWSRLACMLRSRCMPPSLSSKLSPLCPCEPRLPRGEMQAVLCSARSNTRLLPAFPSQSPPAGIRSVRKYNTR